MPTVEGFKSGVFCSYIGQFLTEIIILENKYY